MNRKIALFTVFVCLFLTVGAQQTLDLPECRKLALDHNKDLKIAKENIRAAQEMQKAAFTQFLPSFSAFGNYTWNQKNISLMGSDAFLPIGVLDQNGKFGIGSPTSPPHPNGDGTYTIDGLAVNNKFVMIDGQAVPLDAKGNPFDPTKNPENLMWKNYAILPKDAMEFDIQNVFVGGISFVQPIFMGGKIIELNKIAKYNEQIAQANLTDKTQEIIVNIDEAYWRVVSIENKVSLAKEYRQLLIKMDSDICAMQQEGLVTKSEVLKVKVKLNEADLSLTKAENGLKLSRMALNQLCGLPLDQTYELSDSKLQDTIELNEPPSIEDVYERRPEIQMLVQAQNIAESNRKIMNSRFMPNIALTGSYLTTNPNVYNGFQQKFGGMFTVGISATIPLFHFGERIYTRNAAQSATVVAKLKLDDTKEKIRLQIDQNRYRITESLKKQLTAKTNVDVAEENLMYAQEGYSAGVITSSDLLAAQTAWVSAKSDYIDALIDVKLNNLYLKKSLGQLTESFQ
jgi:outer membrane protein TolC